MMNKDEIVSNINSMSELIAVARSGLARNELVEIDDIQGRIKSVVESVTGLAPEDAIEMKPGKGAQLVRSAGTSAQLMAREGKMATLRLPSGEMRMVHVDCLATIGEVGNSEHENQRIGKAGRSRWLGKRSNVRGVAMNPVDHPMGGGEGRSSGGRHPCTPWGKPTKGKRTRSNKATDKFIVRSRHKRKK